MRNYIDEVEAAYMTSQRQGDMTRDPARDRGTHDDRRNRYPENPSQPGAEMYGRSTEPKRQTMDYHQPAGSMNRQELNHCGKGPKNYNRSDERIKELVCERLCDDPEVDASNIEVEVKNADVILRGEVNEKSEKYLAEDLAASVTGVSNVENLIRVNKRQIA
jgi:hypothetical protein